MIHPSPHALRVMTSLFQRLSAAVRHSDARVAVLSAAAAAIAFGLGSLTPEVSAVVAAITALVSVRPTFHGSMQEGLRQVLGVAFGGAFAWAALHVVGYSALSLFLTVIVCFIAAHLLRLGHDGAVAVGVTVILVVGPHFSPEAVETRFLGVIVGSAVALAVSFFTRPGTPHGRALADVADEADRTSELLVTIAATLESHEGRINLDTAREWLAEAEDILASTGQIHHDASDAVDGARWTPLIAEDDAQAVLEQVRITEGTALTVVSMCRDLVASAGLGQSIPAELAASLSDVLLATAGAISSQSDSARTNPAETLSEHTGPVRIVTATRREAVDHVRGADDTTPLLLGGSMLRDSEKITELLSGH